jgi:exopolyphosphatase / guanosine-5'-triphosphate,3'-diphosphate pyrophosphatase
MWGRHHHLMPVGVVDVGSNTVRLVVKGEGRTLLTAREMLRLGADIEREGAIPSEQIARAAEVVRRYVEQADDIGADVDVLITSPGRQASNRQELLTALAEASGRPTRILGAAEEGQLAFLGALETALLPPRRSVAVVDVGGGSSQVVVGTRRDGPQWSRSIDLGSQRLTNRLLSEDPPGREALEAARAEVERLLEGVDPPACRTALAVGGSARALKRLVGGRLTADTLEEALTLLASTATADIVDPNGVGPERLRTLAAGTTILACLQRRLGTPLKVVRAGLREGALSQLAARSAAA